MNNYQAIKDAIVCQDADSILVDVLAHEYLEADEPRYQARVIRNLLTLKGNQEELLSLIHQYCDELLFAYAEQRVWEDQQQLTTGEDQ